MNGLTQVKDRQGRKVDHRTKAEQVEIDEVSVQITIVETKEGRIETKVVRIKTKAVKIQAQKDRTKEEHLLLCYNVISFWKLIFLPWPHFTGGKGY